MTYLPLPLPSDAPSIIPGKSNNCIFASLMYKTPGIHVKVVNSYAAASLSVLQSILSIDDLPTDGYPIITHLALPFFSTSNPSPLGPFLDPASSYIVLSLANRAFNYPQ